MVSVTCRLEDAQRTVYESREKIERQNQQLSDYEAEINLLRRRLETLETDREKDKKIIATLQEALNRTRLVSSVTSFPIPGLSKSLRCRPLSLPSILTIETLQKQFNRRDNAVIYVHRPLHCES